jgi:hypothetical protein
VGKNPTAFPEGKERRRIPTGPVQGIPSDELERQAAQVEIPALVHRINKELDSKLHTKPGQRLYKKLKGESVIITSEGFSYDFGTMCDHYDESPVYRSWVDASIEAACKKGTHIDKTRKNAMVYYIRKTDNRFNPYLTWRQRFARGANDPCEARFQKAFAAHNAKQAQALADDPKEGYRLQYLGYAADQWGVDEMRQKTLTAAERDAVLSGEATIMDFTDRWQEQYPRFPEEREWLDQIVSLYDYGD